ncbi:MAG: hypothetical protein F4Y70_14485 [Chloroflexi bacterium]|nr:hypothetical protein [Chloroflexota bacterium]MYA94028.1 hypothetical protein [Chloroflexota bacterium]MYC54872.1 hypothetical protein [Chloroflexota bacterium]MYD38471.1 hypothetical protein [Chloroflexota bacterium]MYE80191.1 hypothetical protein [Chloroflexota bacterium]
MWRRRCMRLSLTCASAPATSSRSMADDLYVRIILDIGGFVMRLLIALLILLAGVSIAYAHGAEDHEDDSAEAPVIAGADIPEHPTYHEHVRAIIEANCVACHSDGQIAAYAPLTSTEDVMLAAEDIKSHVINAYMPPWPPSQEGLPLQNDRRLSDTDIALIAAWVDVGAALGDPESFAPAATDGFDVPEVRANLTLQLDEPYTPAADLLDDYRCFALPLNISEPMFITGYEFIPDVAEMAHHAIFYVVDAESDRAIQRAEATDGEPGWQCYGGIGIRARHDSFGGWVPGALPLSFPSGAGFRIESGQSIVIQMHYNLSIERQPDQSQLVLEMESVDSQLDEITILSMSAPVEIPCPAGVEGAQCERAAAVKRVGDLYGEDARYTPDYLLYECGQSLADYAENRGEAATGHCDMPIRSALTIFDAAGHMHELGSSFRLELNPGADDALVLLDIPRWDFHWQGNYQFVEPLRVQRGDVLRMTCTWDNSLSDEPRYVVWGEGTTDEMCFGSLMALRD